MSAANEKMFSSLNPCCNGIYSMRNHTANFVQFNSGLNPCCNGIYSMRLQKMERGNRRTVLILVVMEYTQ